MKYIEFYCSHHFGSPKAKDMLALDWLQAKLDAANHTVDDLLFVDHKVRDMNRIHKIMKAMKHWQMQSNRLYLILLIW